MKRLWSIITALSILFSLTATSFAVNDEFINVEQVNLLAEDITDEVTVASEYQAPVREVTGCFATDKLEQEIPDSDVVFNEIPEMEIEALVSEDADTFRANDGMRFRVLDQFDAISEELDMSNAVKASDCELKITDTVFSTSTKKAATVDAQDSSLVSNPMIFVINPESLKDGKATTDTLYFLATRWNNEDLCYDPAGGNLQIIYNTSFPSGYIEAMPEPANKEYAGYVIRIFNEGSYPFVFAFASDSGNTSEIYSLQFDIIRRGVFTSISDKLSSVTDVKEYPITVDYSLADVYSLGILRTGSGGCKAEILMEDGTVFGTTSLSGPKSLQYVSVYGNLTKPEGVTGKYTFTLRISAYNDDSYVNNDTSYKVAYGAESQNVFFFEDVSEALDLAYFHKIRNYEKQVEDNFHVTSHISELGNYYKIKTIGNEVVTLTSTYGQYEFKILDPNSFVTLFDSSDLTPFELWEGGGIWKRVELEFGKNASYYVVVYCPENLEPKGSYTITVGERRMFNTSGEWTVSPMQITKGQTYALSFNLNTPNSLPGYADRLIYRPKEAGWPSEGGYFDVLTPGMSVWRPNPSKFDGRINFGLSDLGTPLVRADGTWKLRFTAAKTGTYPGALVDIYYHFEV